MQKWALSTQLEIVCNIHKVQQASCCFGWLVQAKQSKAKAKQCEMQCRLRSWMYRAHHIRTQNNWSSKQQFVSLRAVSQLSDTVSKRRSCVFAKFEFFLRSIYGLQCNRLSSCRFPTFVFFSYYFQCEHIQLGRE